MLISGFPRTNRSSRRRRELHSHRTSVNPRTSLERSASSPKLMGNPPQLGYWLGRALLGNGYATEAVREVVRICALRVRRQRVLDAWWAIQRP